MARYIDVDVVMETLMNEVETSGSNCIHIDTIKRLLQDTDTAYDVEKVIEKLDELFAFKPSSYGAVADWVVNEVKDIVRKGGNTN